VRRGQGWRGGWRGGSGVEQDERAQQCGGAGEQVQRGRTASKKGVEQGKGEGVGVAEGQVGRCTRGMFEVEVSCVGSGAGGRPEAEVYRV